MAEDIKFTDDELKEISDIRTAYAEITNRFGQITLTRHNLDAQEEKERLEREQRDQDGLLHLLCFWN